MNALGGLQIGRQVRLRRVAELEALTGHLATGVEETPLVSQGSFTPLTEARS
jgi:hypothetical protein